MRLICNMILTLAIIDFLCHGRVSVQLNSLMFELEFKCKNTWRFYKVLEAIRYNILQ